MPKNKHLTYIDIFAGCGGLSLGLHNAGWKGIFALEKSPFAFETLKCNLIDKLGHFEWPLWLEKKNHDINNVLKTKKEELFKLQGNIDLVVGGPPCQGFSSAGPRFEDDSRNELIHAYISFIRIVQPKVIFFENVKGFTQKFEQNKTKGIRYSEFVQKSLKRSSPNFTGYEVIGKLVDFAEYGIPQKRTRFILVGVRKDLVGPGKEPASFFTLIKENKERFLVNKGLGLNHSIEEAISDLLESNGTTACPDSKGFLSGLYTSTKTPYQQYLRQGMGYDILIPDSHRFAWHNEHTILLFKTLIEKAVHGKKITGDARKEFDIKKRGVVILEKSAPAPTLTSHPDDYIHYSEPRILTVREYARIQTFPDWYQFKRKYTTGGHLRKVEVPRYTQIGNAIPPLFGELAGLFLQNFV